MITYDKSNLIDVSSSGIHAFCTRKGSNLVVARYQVVMVGTNSYSEMGKKHNSRARRSYYVLFLQSSPFRTPG